MKKISKLNAVVLSFFLVISLMTGGCSDSDDNTAQHPSKKSLLIYCGITMVHPMRELAQIIETEHNCDIEILQGGSEDLYQSLKMSKQGDLYLPGSDSYRKNHLKEGMLSDYIYVGYNQAALLVAPGNPKQISNDINIMTDVKHLVSIGNAESSSVGRQAKKILSKAGIYEQVVQNAVKISSDSRTMNNLLKDGMVDIILNWRATAYFPENKDKMDPILLPETIAKKNRLLINLTTCSKHPELAKAFMRLAGSKKGQEIFKKWGFLDDVGESLNIES